MRQPHQLESTEQLQEELGPATAVPTTAAALACWTNARCSRPTAAECAWCCAAPEICKRLLHLGSVSDWAAKTSERHAAAGYIHPVQAIFVQSQEGVGCTSANHISCKGHCCKLCSRTFQLHSGQLRVQERCLATAPSQTSSQPVCGLRYKSGTFLCTRYLMLWSADLVKQSLEILYLLSSCGSAGTTGPKARLP